MTARGPDPACRNELPILTADPIRAERGAQVSATAKLISRESSQAACGHGYLAALLQPVTHIANEATKFQRQRATRGDARGACIRSFSSNDSCTNIDSSKKLG